MFADYCEKLGCMEKYNNLNRHIVEFVYDIEMCLSDHTGTISCRLMGKHGEMLLGRTVEEFLTLSDAEKAALKWRCLLERCAIKMIVKRKSAECTKNMINIVECVLANPEEVAEKIKIY
jgi:meiosis-specific with OB domain-containing protein